MSRLEACLLDASVHILLRNPGIPQEAACNCGLDQRCHHGPSGGMQSKTQVHIVVNSCRLGGSSRCNRRGVGTHIIQMIWGGRRLNSGILAEANFIVWGRLHTRPNTGQQATDICLAIPREWIHLLQDMSQ
jgi:hypothetical protein